MSLKNPKTLRKMLRKSQASNAWAATFKNPDFSKSFLYKILAFFSYLLMLVPSSSVDMERLKYKCWVRWVVCCWTQILT